MSTLPPDKRIPVTEALNGANANPARALDAVMPLVYEDLRALAVKTMASRSLTLQPTALVNETYLRLTRERKGWSDHNQFMVAAAVAMRRALVDHLRRRSAAKRSHERRSNVDVETIAIEGRGFEILALEDALTTLEREDASSAQVVELLIFGGLTGAECAEALGVSRRTIQRRWRFARAWLVERLAEESR